MDYKTFKEDTTEYIRKYSLRDEYPSMNSREVDIYLMWYINKRMGKGDPVKKVKAGKERILVSAKVDKEFFRSGEIVYIEKWLG